MPLPCFRPEGILEGGGIFQGPCAHPEKRVFKGGVGVYRIDPPNDAVVEA